MSHLRISKVTRVQDRDRLECKQSAVLDKGGVEGHASAAPGDMPERLESGRRLLRGSNASGGFLRWFLARGATQNPRLRTAGRENRPDRPGFRANPELPYLRSQRL